MRAAGRDVGSGWVLTSGDIVFKLRDGVEQVQPGWWLAQIQNGKVAAALYYRTLDEARNALRLDESEV